MQTWGPFCPGWLESLFTGSPGLPRTYPVGLGGL
jgi:hypothetical protein